MSGAEKLVFGTEQERAKWAWDKVDEVAPRPGTGGRSGAVEKRYGTLARKLPSYLQVSGVGQTLAFLYAKGKGEGATGTTGAGAKGDGVLLRHLRERVLMVLANGGAVKAEPRDVMQVVLQLDPDQYRLETAELAAAATWLKRFAEGRLGEEEEGAGDAK